MAFPKADIARPICQSANLYANATQILVQYLWLFVGAKPLVRSWCSTPLTTGSNPSSKDSIICGEAPSPPILGLALGPAAAMQTAVAAPATAAYRNPPCESPYS
jgi:hypothetical protein